VIGARPFGNIGEARLPATAAPPIRLPTDLPVGRCAERAGQPRATPGRSLIERVVPTPLRDALAELYGELATMTAMTDGAAPKSKRCDVCPPPKLGNNHPARAVGDVFARLLPTKRDGG